MPDYSRQQLVDALRRADAAGDTGAAKAIAQRLVKMKEAEAPAPPPRSGLGDAFVYGLDSAGLSLGRAAREVGRDIADLPVVSGVGGGIAEWGAAKEESNREDIARRNYQRPEGLESPTVALGEGRLGDAAKGIMFAGAETAPRTAASIGATSAAALAALGSAPVALPVAAGGALYTAFDSIGQNSLEKEEKGLDPDAGPLDYLSAGASGAIEVIPGGGKLVATPLRFALREGAEEVAQEMLQVGNSAAQGGEYTLPEVALRASDAGLTGGVLGGTVKGTTSGVSSASSYLKNTKYRSELRSMDEEVARSTLRVAEMFEKANAEALSTKSGASRDLNHDNTVMRNVWHRLRDETESAAKMLRDSDQISPEQHKQMIATLKRRAGNQSSALTKEDLVEIETMGLRPDIAEGLQRALIDLDTISREQKIRNQDGPFKKTFGKVGQAAGTLAGWSLGMSGGPSAAYPSSMLGLSAGGKAGETTGAAIDRAFGLGKLPVSTRLSKLKAEGARLNLEDIGDTRKFLSDLNAELSNNRVVLDEKTAQDRAKRLTQLDKINQKLISQNIPGTEGNFWHTIWSRTGLLPQEAIKVVGEVRNDGTIDEDTYQAFLSNPKSLMKDYLGLNIIDAMHVKASEIGAKRVWEDPSGKVSGGGASSQGGDRPTIYSPTRYAETVRRANDTRMRALSNAEATGIPGLSVDVERVANAKSKAEKRAALSAALSKYPEGSREKVRMVLTPLTMFGPDTPSK
ncbi:hypothetical protein [Pyruvatibacter mobilis]|uniref:hypothetical protein n=1 Tax=Pyruvatibacter mobilis TaxID=1712261 RepID=UPI003BA98D36